MRAILFILINTVLMAGCLWNCQSESSKASDEKATVEQNEVVASPNEHWQKLFNTSFQELDELYTIEALKVEEDGNVYNGQSEIFKSLQEFKNAIGKVASISTIKNVAANPAGDFEYEIGQFKTSDGKEYKHLLIWNTQDSLKKRELEFIAPFTATAKLDEVITTYRNKWIERCNQHNAQQLVKELYAENAVYYNHKPAIIGRTAITIEYSYMNNESYTLSLEPIIVETVQEDLVFEIGQCSGSYLGKYVIIWKKQDSGMWEVLLDSNI